jgi:hypothetical protein
VALLALVENEMPLIFANWRIYVALAFMVAEAFAGWKLHNMGYESGRAEVQGMFDSYRATVVEQAMAAQAERTVKEQAMQAANSKVSSDYESLKVATGVAVRALDADRMRLQAALSASRHTAPSDPGAGLPPDDSAQVGVLAECIDRYAAVASEADSTSDTLKALQDYVRKVVPQ